MLGMRLGVGLSLAWCLAAGLTGQKQSTAPPDPPFRTVGGMFAVSVADLDASVRWYSEKLGLTVVNRLQTPDKIGVAILEGGGLIVELIHKTSAAPRPRAAQDDPTLVHGFFKVGIIVDDLDRTLTTLRKRGIEIPFGPYPAKPNQRANAMIRDNAGNLIQLFGK